MLGICYGMQLMARDLGGAVERTGLSEFGKTEVELGESALFHDLPSEQTVWMSHGDSVTAPPSGAVVTASSPSTPIAAFEDRGARALRRAVPPRGHAHAARPGDPEELPLRGGRRAADWTPAAVIEEQVALVRAAVGNGARPLRAVRRRRLGGRGAARAQGRRRPADVRLRRQRPPARERGRAGRGDVLAATSASRSSTSRRRAVPRAARGRDRPRGEAHDRRRGVHPRVRGGGREAG